MIICYTNYYEENEALYEFLEKADKLKKEIHLFSDYIINDTIIPEILHEADGIYNTGDIEDYIVFVTDDEILFKLVFRLLHNSFSAFVLIEKNKVNHYNLPEMYNCIINTPLNKREITYKDVYSNRTTISYADINIYCKSVEKLFLCDFKPKYETCQIFQNYYFLKNTYYLFEPVDIRSEKNIVIIDGAINEKQHFLNSCYMYYYNAEQLADFIEEIYVVDQKVITDRLVDKANELKINLERCLPYEQKLVQRMLLDLEWFQEKKFLYRKIYLYHYLLITFGNSFFYECFLEEIVKSELLNYENKYFVWNQCRRYGMLHPDWCSEKVSQLHEKLYEFAYNHMYEEYKTELKEIKNEERNNDIVVVMAVQILGDRHAPTHSALERCYNLIKFMGKRVILVNTREYCSMIGNLPLAEYSVPNVLEEYNSIEEYKYKDVNIPFIQIPVPVPNKKVIFQFINYIKKLKPSCILSVGSGSLLSDICGNIVPQMAMGVVFSQLPTTKSIFSVIGRRIKEEEWVGLEAKGYTKDNIIESTFTFELQQQKGTFTRKEFGIPEDKFVLVVVGIRLDYDVTDKFIEYMEQTYKLNTHIVFAGVFDTYIKMCEKHLTLREHSTFIGYCNDMLALMEICDLYVNPERLGGGFSIIEAFYKGVPGVSINRGDVSISGGIDFTVPNYKDMVEVIKRYIKDKAFYEVMVQKAKKRTEVVLDGSEALKEIFRKLENNKLFW